MGDELFEKGLKIRREVLGAEYVDASIKNATDFNRPLQELVTKYCWGEIWNRPGLSRRERLLTDAEGDAVFAEGIPELAADDVDLVLVNVTITDPMNRLVTGLEKYLEKRRTAAEAAQVIRSGDCVYIHPGCAEPEQLVKAMVARAEELRKVKVIHILTRGIADYVRPEMAGSFRHVALFSGANVRDAIPFPRTPGSARY